MKRVLLLFCLLCFIGGQWVSGQRLEVPFFNHLSLSQNTNLYIYESSEKLVYISSTDGLTIYNGLQSTVYRPSTHQMYGYNVQSPFFEDSFGKIWFTTYEALNYYDPKIDSLGYFFMMSKAGETLKENYKAFYIDGDLIYLKAGNEVFIYDVQKRAIANSFDIDFSHFFQMTVLKNPGGDFLFGGAQDTFTIYQMQGGNEIKIVGEGKTDIRSIFTDNHNICWIGLGNGTLSLYDPLTNSCLFNYKVADTPISGITSWADSKLLLSASSDKLLLFDLNLRRIEAEILPRHPLTKEVIRQMLIPYLSPDSTLWVGGDGQGVFFTNLHKPKFRHFLASERGQLPVSVIKIIDCGTDSLLIFTRKSGIRLMNSEGRTFTIWDELPNGKKGFTPLTGALVHNRKVLFSSYNDLYILDLNTGKISALFTRPEFANFRFAQIERLSNGRIIASCYEKMLNEISLQGGSYTLTPYGSLGNEEISTTYFKEDALGNLYVSNDEVTIELLLPKPEGHQHMKGYSLPLAGGIKSLVTTQDKKAVYLANSQGLFFMDLSSRKLHQIVDQKQKLLQTVYAVLQDAIGNLWLGTNNGLLKYDPGSGEVKVFGEADGVQALEFNTHAGLRTDDGQMYFGGVNGINAFRPDKIRLLDSESPVYLSEIKINDELDSMYLHPQYIQQLVLPYSRNTISFEFHAIDFSYPESTRVQYTMQGVDNDYIESREANGFGRYPNLRPGKYIFKILGRNSDGVLNPLPREIHITILPPFWATWWFLMLSAIFLIGVVALFIRAYFQRRLQKKNQLLREQALLIDKQQAVERERTRIASEMHDDLGSGLTTIRYLSDKALTQVKDEDEAAQIRRIAEHSNALVRNMSEIIWAMNARFDNADCLVSYLRRYASEYLEDHQQPFHFTITDEHWDQIPFSGERRRNIFLVFKELLHNTVKYACASNVDIRITTGEEFEVRILEKDAMGFDPETSMDKGNGLFNMKKRMDSIGGNIYFRKLAEGMEIIISLPLQPTQHGET